MSFLHMHSVSSLKDFFFFLLTKLCQNIFEVSALELVNLQYLYCTYKDTQQSQDGYVVAV